MMGALLCVTLFAMVIAPYCTGIMHQADLYKLGSLCVFIPAFYFLAWRKNSLVAAILIPVIQIFSGLMFASYINSLPMTCP
jgi:hypothetical protein